MQTFTGWEYLLIDAANQYGLDKLQFDARIQWAIDNLNNLEKLGDDQVTWKEKPLYLKAVQAIRKAQAGKPTGHLVGFDAVCSGMQIMSAMTGCKAGATATGLVDPNRRADAYTDCTKLMQKRLPTVLDNLRSDVKQAVMTCLYGSKMEPIYLFGDGTPELNAFYEALYELAPGACDLLEALINSWDKTALVHSWTLPDGYVAHVPVMDKVETRIEVDELGHSTFSYEYEVNTPLKHSVSNAANVIHSVDAYILRCIERRCNYDAEVLEQANNLLVHEAMRRAYGGGRTSNRQYQNNKFYYYEDQYNRSGMADVVILPHLNYENVTYLSNAHLDKLVELTNTMKTYKPFPVITVHDEFKCHPNNMNYLRMQYRDVLAEIADSNLVDDLLSQIYKVKGTFERKSKDLSKYIRQSNYALT